MSNNDNNFDLPPPPHHARSSSSPNRATARHKPAAREDTRSVVAAAGAPGEICTHNNKLTLPDQHHSPESRKHLAMDVLNTLHRPHGDSSRVQGGQTQGDGKPEVITSLKPGQPRRSAHNTTRQVDPD